MNIVRRRLQCKLARQRNVDKITLDTREFSFDKILLMFNTEMLERLQQLFETVVKSDAKLEARRTALKKHLERKKRVEERRELKARLTAKLGFAPGGLPDASSISTFKGDSSEDAEEGDAGEAADGDEDDEDEEDEEGLTMSQFVRVMLKILTRDPPGNDSDEFNSDLGGESSEEDASQSKTVITSEINNTEYM